MKRILFALFGLILAISKVIIPFLLGIILACLLCNIHEGEPYSWISGIWHGLFFLPNFVRYLIDSDVLYKATNYTSIYNIYWWIITVLEVIMTIPFVLFVIIAPFVALTTPKEDLDKVFD